MIDIFPEYCSNIYKQKIDYSMYFYSTPKTPEGIKICLRAEKHPNEEAEELLKQGLAEIRQMEAFTGYGYPTLCMVC